MPALAVWQGSNINIKMPPVNPVTPVNSPSLSPSPKPSHHNSNHSSSSSSSSSSSKPIKGRSTKSNSSHSSREPRNGSNSRSNQHHGSHSKNESANNENLNRNGIHENSKKIQNGAAWHSGKNWENEATKKPKDSVDHSVKSLNQEETRGNKNETSNGSTNQNNSNPTSGNRARSASKTVLYLHPHHSERNSTTPPLSTSSSSIEKPLKDSNSVSKLEEKKEENVKENSKEISKEISKENSNKKNKKHNNHGHGHGHHHHNRSQMQNDWAFQVLDKIPTSNSKEFSPHPEIFDLDVARGNLTGDQVSRLQLLLDEECNIVSKDKSLRIKNVTPFRFISKLISKLAMSEIFLLETGIRLVGSGAAHVLVEPQAVIDIPEDEVKSGEISGNFQHLINDIDFCFYVPEGTEFYRILQIEESVIIEFLEEMDQNTRKYSLRDIYTQFFLDSVKVESESPREGWSLITIGEQGQRTIDIKFVIKSKRSWVFSADSFEIILDPFFQQVTQCSKNVTKFTKKVQWTDALRDASNFVKSADKALTLNENIQVESLYADYIEALEHLRNKRLFTKRPEEIRRGIFRYCHELAKGKSPTDSEKNKLDKIFVDSFLGEKSAHFDFEEILKKFLVKHVSSSLLCLNQLYEIFVRSGHTETKGYLEVIRKKKEEYENVGLHHPVHLDNIPPSPSASSSPAIV